MVEMSFSFYIDFIYYFPFGLAKIELFFYFTKFLLKLFSQKSEYAVLSAKNSTFVALCYRHKQ